MLKLEKLIQPTVDIVTVQLEEFDVGAKLWCHPFEASFSLAKQKFATGSFREAYMYHATAVSNLSPGNYVLKKFKKEQEKEVKKLFNSMDENTRKMVQMNALAKNFALKLASQAPVEFGPTLSYIKVYFSKLYGQCITLEPYMEGTFTKHVNNTGQLCGDYDELRVKVETFSHYTYIKSNKQLMVLDIQGTAYTLSYPEIATSNLLDEEHWILFCCRNLSTTAIQKFPE